eukprot:3941927-Rhodomonas_salina.3
MSAISLRACYAKSGTELLACSVPAAGRCTARAHHPTLPRRARGTNPRAIFYARATRSPAPSGKDREEVPSPLCCYTCAMRCPVLKPLTLLSPVSSYAMCGTERVYGAPRSYAMSGTELGYGATRMKEIMLEQQQRQVRQPHGEIKHKKPPDPHSLYQECGVSSWISPCTARAVAGLRTRSTPCGTDIGYAATRSGPR